MSLKRVSNWRTRLDQIISSAQELDFEWGSFDCVLHVCNCIRAITVSGTDPALNHRGKYSTEAEAVAIFGSSLQNFIATEAAALGMPEVPVTLARRGDVVFIDNSTPQGAVGIVSTDGRYASCVGSKGHVLVTIHRWRRAWQVG